MNGYDYNGYFIEQTYFGFTVFFCGDELVFSTEEDAENFIDELQIVVDFLYII